MFTGIIEAIGQVVHTEQRQSNLQLTIRSSFSPELKPEQSVAHNGVCLTVVGVSGNTHQVEAVTETLKRTTLGRLTVGSYVNLERAMPAQGRFDGHYVQGHVDQKGTCLAIDDMDGSKKYWFSYRPEEHALLTEKGSICVDGVSLTIVDCLKDSFSVAVIPYTFEQTCFKFLKPGDTVNLEFDIIGKYVIAALKQQNLYRPSMT
ncbi:MAG: riboflavin synthase subunit alpha [Chitinophagales bacterium]|nr:MAG: riboflavin synthase subunit alpha [Chitinophagales bacterium]